MSLSDRDVVERLDAEIAAQTDRAATGFPCMVIREVLEQAKAEITRLRASQAKVVEANRKLDVALCNYTNWTDDFGATDSEHPRVFKMLCDAYNAWHRALAEHPGGQT